MVYATCRPSGDDTSDVNNATYFVFSASATGIGASRGLGVDALACVTEMNATAASATARDVARLRVIVDSSRSSHAATWDSRTGVSEACASARTVLPSRDWHLRRPAARSGTNRDCG